MAIYDFNEFAEYCLIKLVHKTDCKFFPRELQEYLADFLVGTAYCLRDKVSQLFCADRLELRLVRKNTKTGKITAVIFAVDGQWLALFRCGDGVEAKKSSSFADLWNILRDKELHEKHFTNFFAESDGGIDGLLKDCTEKAREKLLFRCAVLASYCSAKKKINPRARAVCWGDTLSETYEHFFGSREGAVLRAIGTLQGRVFCALFTCNNRLHVVADDSAYDLKLTPSMLTALVKRYNWLPLDCFFAKRLEKLTA